VVAGYAPVNTGRQAAVLVVFPAGHVQRIKMDQPIGRSKIVRQR
jgi:hypothetical protein